MTVFTFMGGVEVETVRFVVVIKPFCRSLQLTEKDSNKDMTGCNSTRQKARFQVLL